MDLKRSLVLAILAGSAAVLFLLRNYEGIGILPLLVVFVGVSWLVFSLTDPDRTLQFLGFLQNPPMTALIAFFGAFIYMTYSGFPPGKSFLASFVAALFGGLTGFLIFKYWNIGG